MRKKSTFFSPQKLFLFLKYFNLCSDAFGHVGKRLDKKAKGNLKIHDVIYWETNAITITHIAQYLKK